MSRRNVRCEVNYHRFSKLVSLDGAASNKQSESAGYARKVEEETADFHRKPFLWCKVTNFFLDRAIPVEFKVALQQARTAKGWTQKDLAQRINEKQSVVNEYETGRVVPNPQVISKLQRALGVSLPKIPKKKATHDDEE